ncbi:hydrogenase maturation protease [Demequina sp. SYSU T00039]|uniref:Hydrogenase maturation protease n=1 Tax=Demequina lignilytica TaxID=3051663 RepID=A0AAW7M824_9MICO|nr:MULTISPECIES: hydrogenase maturation protease [unclassified Demequina]MDN4477287.1 hydrogenase maturation protease [Demequina sp. SYSU T00039-1]MDN4487460.1 hydrogenase maturation protease [Demequina sp. SYSU T00039]
MSEKLVIGLGSPDRGDDAVGGVVAERIGEIGLCDVRVIPLEDPLSLSQAWDGAAGAVVIDAVASGGPPGAVHVREVGAGAEPLPTHAFTAAGRGGSHAFGLAGAVELSRTLGTLPRRVTVVGVEAATFQHGRMSPEVTERVDDAVHAVLVALKEMDTEEVR